MNTGAKVISVVKGLLMNTYGEVISESGDRQGESGDYMVAENGLVHGGLMGPVLMVATATTSPTE